MKKSRSLYVLGDVGLSNAAAMAEGSKITFIANPHESNSLALASRQLKAFFAKAKKRCVIKSTRFLQKGENGNWHSGAIFTVYCVEKTKHKAAEDSDEAKRLEHFPEHMIDVSELPDDFSMMVFAGPDDKPCIDVKVRMITRDFAKVGRTCVIKPVSIILEYKDGIWIDSHYVEIMA
ncbi:hypothetical protein ACI2KR_06700 [Pseudomonas luteola]